jgi:hypothetical protein
MPEDPTLREQMLDQIRERAELGTEENAVADRTWLLADHDRLCDLIDGGLAQAVYLGSNGVGITHALSGDPGAVVEADPLGRHGGVECS